MTDPAAPTGWRTATVAEVRQVEGAVILRLDVPHRPHLPGQHYVLRLTAEDGYVAQRSYSLACAPDDPLVELAVERLADGEVSGFLADVLAVGDELEVRGPIGGFFVWPGDAPALGVAGGSGVVPLVSMLRHARALGRPELLRLAVSARSLARLLYADELLAAGATIALTRESSDRVARPLGRLAPADLAPLIRPGDTSFICGSSPFAEAAGELLVDLGVPSASIRIERFGASG